MGGICVGVCAYSRWMELEGGLYGGLSVAGWGCWFCVAVSDGIGFFMLPCREVASDEEIG